MSAPLRYARILNGLSSLISRRSAISRRMRAIARLSNPEAFALDLVVEQPRAARGEGASYRGARVGGAVAEQATAAAGAADLGGRRPRRPGAFDQIVDCRRRDARREPLAIVPFDRDLAADLVPVAALERDAHRGRRLANPFEALEDVAIAVDVALGDLPVVRARISRRAGVGEDDAPLELVRIHGEADARNA